MTMGPQNLQGGRTQDDAGQRNSGAECVAAEDSGTKVAGLGSLDGFPASSVDALAPLLGEFELTDLLGLEVLQRMQDGFTAATGVGSVITSLTGQPITRASQCNRLCAEIVCTTKQGLANCRRSDRQLGKPNPDGPTVYSCLGCGLWDAGASIFVGKRHLASWLIGPVRDQRLGREDMSRYARELAVDEERFVAAYEEIEAMSADQFRQVANILFLMANQLSEQAYQRVVQTVLLERSRQAEEQVRASDERLALVMDATQDAVWDWNLETEWAYLSPQYYEMLGYGAGDFAPCRDSWRQLVHPEDLAATEAELNRHLNDEIPHYQTEYRMQAKDGSWRWLRSRGRVVDRAADGRPLRMLGTHIDITEQKQEVEKEAQSQERLQRIQRFESLGVLAGGVAHDFNNYLMCIMGNLELAAMELPENAEAAEFIEEAMTAARRSAELCRQMLAYAGRRAMQTEVVDVVQILRESSSLLQVTGGGRAVVDVALPPQPLLIRADLMEIQQVVMNLVTNAMEAVSGPQATVSVSVRALDCSQQFLDELCFGEGLPAGRYAVIRVGDSGSGMTPEVMDRAFEPFFSTKFQGRGLGLPASLGIARAHGGSISLKSEPGEGTVAQLILPLVAEDARRTGDTTDVEVAGTLGDLDWRGTGRILLVDDELAIRDIARKMLERAGFEVVMAESGVRAVEIFRESHQELAGVLLDWAMPGMSGGDVLHELRRTDPDVPVVLASGYSQSELTELLSTELLGGIVHKPFSYDRLREAMRIATSGKDR